MMSIDHGLLSPSGRMSKRARAAALERERGRLFPPGFWDSQKTAGELAAEKAATLRRSAQNLRELAARGMSPRRFAREAAKLEQQAAEIEGSQ